MELVQVKEKERIDDLQIKEYRIIQKTDWLLFLALMQYFFLIMPK